MEGGEVLVVQETPSLGEAILELLRSDGFEVESVQDSNGSLGSWTRKAGHPPKVLICASNSHRCETARRWFRGDIQANDLVIVGSRDPGLQSAGHLHVVGLPLTPTRFLELIHRLSDAPVATKPSVDASSLA